MEIKQVIPVPQGKKFFEVFEEDGNFSASPVYFFALAADVDEDDGDVFTYTYIEGVYLLDGIFDLCSGSVNSRGVYSEEEMLDKFPDIRIDTY